MSIKKLVGKRVTKTVSFMGDKVTISKLSVDEVMRVQETVKDIESGDDTRKGFEVMKVVIKSSVEGAHELSDQDFDTFPLDELSSLSNEIIKFSGMGPQGNES